jgi:hypothetical protein
LDSVLAARLDESVLEQIIAETGGNPLALLELPRGLTPAQLAGGFGLPAAMPLSSGIEQSYARRLARLPRHARLLLLLAAAEPVGDPALLWRAAQQLEIPDTAARALESEDLLTVDGSVAFRHPLVRSAVYGAAEPNERRQVHSALADATDPQLDPDRRAWRLRCSCRLPRARGNADTRSRTPCAAHAGRGPDEVPGGRNRRRARSARLDGDRRARRARSRPS